MKMKGLSSEEVNKLMQDGKNNFIKNSASKSVIEIILSNLLTYFNLIFLILAILVILSGSFKNLMFLPVVIINLIIGIFQQLKSKKILDKLALLDESSYITIRDDKEVEVISSNLVLNDVIKLESGMQIPADAVVVEGFLSVNESLLTGEIDEIEKFNDDELKSGSFVVSGEAYVKLTAVGEDSYVAKLTKEAKQIKEKPSEMVNDIEKIVKVAGFIVIPVGVLLFSQSVVVNHSNYRDAIVSMVGAVTGMIPEGLYLLVTIALAMSASRLARSKVLLHDMKSIESLARVDVLCVDKTGTITSSKMNVTDIIVAGDDKNIYSKCMDVLSKYAVTITDNNDTIEAIRRYFNGNKKLSAIEVLPFNSKNKYSAIRTKDGLYKLGAFEYLLNKKELKTNKEIIDNYLEKGQRLLAFTKDDKVLLFIAIKNEIRENAIETFNYLQDEGVVIKVISGDNPVTVSSIAMEANIKDADKYVDATSLDTYAKIKEAVNQYTVFGRVKPEQKKDIICAIKESGIKVAMTGDGVNDILAMKEADCSIAMGEGSKAARSSAQVVLLDSDFSKMKNIIFEGRRDINNITRSAILFLYKNLFSLILALFSLFASFNYPLKPTQIAIISFFNIGLPAFLLTFEPNTVKQQGRFIKNVIVNAIPAALTSFSTIIVMIYFARLFEIDYTEVSTASIYLISVVGFNILWFISRPINKYHRCIFLLCILGVILGSRYLGHVFDMREISIKASALCLIFAFAEMEIIRDFTYLLDQIYNKLKSKKIEKMKNILIGGELK